MFSIITVSFNSERTIERTIQSVLQQSSTDIEYIVIDGGSSDGTVKIIQRYSDYIRYWESCPDRGIYNAMNKGLTHASGEYVGFINSDDWYKPDSFKVISSLLQENPDVELFYGSVDLFDSAGNLVGNYGPRFENLDRQMIAHPSCFLKRDCLVQQGGFDESLKSASDYDLFIRLSQRSLKTFYVARALANFTLGGTSSGRIALKENNALKVKYFKRSRVNFLLRNLYYDLTLRG